MVYHFVILSDEVDDFRREIDIDAEDTFMDLHNILIKSCNYKNDEMTSFFICDSNWTKTTEITMVDMNEDPTRESGPIMEKTHLDDMVQKEKDKVLFCFDMMCDRYLYMQLQKIEVKAHKLKPEVTLTKGKAPQQNGNIDDILNGLDDNMYGDEDYDPEEMDAEGYQNLEDIEGSGF